MTVGNLCVVVMEALATERILFCKCFKALKVKRNIVGKQRWHFDGQNSLFPLVTQNALK